MQKKSLQRNGIPLPFLPVLLLGLILLQGCDAVSPSSPEHDEAPQLSEYVAPVSQSFEKLRHPQLLDRARASRPDGTIAKNGEGIIHLMLAFNTYEADGVTPRILKRYDVTRRLLARYGDDIRLKVTMNNAFDGISIKIDESILEEFLNDLAKDDNFAWAEPDFEIGQLWHTPSKDKKKLDQLIPWNVVRVGGGLDKPENNKDVHVYIMDSGISEEDIELGEQKDFTMLFQNRQEEFWDEEIEQVTPVYDPKDKGNPDDESGHGTHIAATLGAVDDKDGMLGVAPEVNIHSLKVLTGDGRTDITTVMAAVDYVTEKKLKHPDWAIIVNMSFGMDIGTEAYNSLDEAIARSIDAGVVYVVSAGNDGKDASTYSPAHVSGTITVGAYNELDTFSTFSNYGPVIDILAPGENILSLSHIKDEVKAQEFILNNGTSFAAPHVTAAVALYMGHNPEASPAEVKTAILDAARAGIQGTPYATTNKTVYAGDFVRDKKKDKAFKIKDAKYDEKKDVLKLSGEAPRLERITLFDQNMHEIAVVTTGFDAKWEAELESPDVIPCTITASFNGQDLTSDVKKRPKSCD